MRSITYYVASSLDGFISGPEGDISRFVMQSSGVDKYLDDLKHYDTVIMGKNTYEFGYRYGLKPGEPAYPHMKHYIFSNTLKLPTVSSSVEIKPVQISEILKIREQSGSDIYLCGGGMLAGWLLDNKQIDTIKVKLNPILLNQGIRMFEQSGGQFSLELVEANTYDKGLQIITYGVSYS
jgi:dihydrofolate reductase